MIIFDLDGTLANCEHRRHFVDRSYLEGCDHWHQIPGHAVDMCDECKIKWKAWKSNWPSFYEACDLDEPIEPVWKMFVDRLDMGLKKDVQIWSGRCESVRKKTEKWLMKHLSPIGECELPILKMRPIGDNTPDDVLKERWLDEALAQGKTIDFVFDDRPKVVRMWRRRGIFVFDCNQTGKEF